MLYESTIGQRGRSEGQVASKQVEMPLSHKSYCIVHFTASTVKLPRLFVRQQMIDIAMFEKIQKESMVTMG